MAELVKVTIDGREALVPKGSLLVEAAKQAGVDIPVFCYHEKMHPVGACRMCLVEIEKVPRLQAACTTPVTDGMVVKTDTPAVVKARQGVLEFLLTNHPLDCPVCDKGGECPLQDTTFKYASDRSRFVEEKRHFVKPVRLSPLIVLDRERCIMCTRCVRFQREIAGDEALTLVQRGSRSEVGVLPGRTFDSPFSGNTTELCPVGALTSAQFRFRGRSWEMKETPSVCSLCSVGCNVKVESRAGQVLRLMSRENREVDDGWLCDQGRFTYQFVNDPARLTTPLVRKNGQLAPASWEEALAVVAQGLKKAGDEGGSNGVGGLISASSTNEELYLFQKLLRTVLKSNSVDHGPHGDYSLPETGLDGSSGSIEGLESADLILVAGVDPLVDQPVLDLRIKKAAWKKGARLVTLSPVQTDLAKTSNPWLKVTEGTEAVVINGLLNLLLAGEMEEAVARERLGALYDKVARAASGYPVERVEEAAGVPAAQLRNLAGMLARTSRVALLFSRPLPGDPEGLREACGRLAMLTGCLGDPEGGLYPLGSECNSQGALDMGALPNLLPGQQPLKSDNLEEPQRLWGVRAPQAVGLSGLQMLHAAAEGRLKALYIAGLDPAGQEDAEAVRQVLSRLEFLVVQAAFLTPTAQLAHVVLPGVSFAEKDGSYTNLERRVQRLQAAVPAPGQAKPDWQILVELANALGAAWRYAGAGDVFNEACTIAPAYRNLRFERLGDQGRKWHYPGVEEGLESRNGHGRKLWYQPLQAQGSGA